MNFLFNITIQLYIQLLGDTSYKFEISQNMPKMFMSGVTFSPYLHNIVIFFQVGDNIH